jgi:hypothetical protein
MTSGCSRGGAIAAAEPQVGQNTFRQGLNRSTATFGDREAPMKIALAALTAATIFSSVDPVPGRVHATLGAQVAAEPTFEVVSIRMNPSVDGQPS